MNMTVFWDAALCNLVGVYQCFRGAYCLHHQGDDGGRSICETLVNFYQTTRRNISEDSHIDTRRHWYLKSHYINSDLKEIGV
jgi:hypothetical protein